MIGAGVPRFGCRCGKRGGDKDYAQDLENKVDAYRGLSKDKRTVHLVMVTTNGIARNSYINMIQNEITLDDLFAV